MIGSRKYAIKDVKELADIIISGYQKFFHSQYFLASDNEWISDYISQARGEDFRSRDQTL